MTGEEFIDALRDAITQRGRLKKEYRLFDLVRDARTIGLSGLVVTELSETSQEDDLAAAREDMAKLGKSGGPHDSSR